MRTRDTLYAGDRLSVHLCWETESLGKINTQTKDLQEDEKMTFDAKDTMMKALAYTRKPSRDQTAFATRHSF